MYIICKEYILRRKDEDIIDRLNMTCERLEEIKSELREDFRKGYFGMIYKGSARVISIGLILYTEKRSLKR